MTIALPQYYNNTDIGLAGGVAQGKEVLASALETIADNNNWMYGRYVGPLAHAFFGDGIRGRSQYTGPSTIQYEDDDEDLAVFAIPGDRAQRGYRVYVYAEHTDGTKDAGKIKIQINGTVAQTITVTAGASAQVWSAAVTNPTTGDQDLVIQNSSYYTRVFSVAVTRERLDNQTVADTLGNALPFYFMRKSGVLAATEPLTDEWINRGLNNTRNILHNQRHSLACITTPIKNETTIAAGEYEASSVYPWGDAGADGSTNVVPKALMFPLLVKHRQTITVKASFRAVAGVTMRLELSPNVTFCTLSPTLSALPTTGTAYTFATASAQVEPGAYLAAIYFDAAATRTAWLYSLSIWGDTT